MRRDMKKKLVDCYRVRSREKNEDVRRDRRESRHLALRLTEDNELEESVPTGRAAGMRMKGWDRKQFGENLAPLYRFLWSCRGKHWDKVYSEISEFCDKDSAVGRHIYEHLWFSVLKDVHMVDGKPHTVSMWREGLYPATSDGQPGGYVNLYIHPKTGVLTEAPREKKVKKEEQSCLHIDDRRFGAVIDNVWYLVEVAPQKYKTVTKEVFWGGEFVKKEVSVPVYEGQRCPDRVFALLPGEVRRKLSGWTETRHPRGYRAGATRINVPAQLYIKTAKTMSKKEKRRYIPKEMK